MTQKLDRSWMPSGTCAQVGMDDWFPQNGGHPKASVVRICRDCPVLSQCLDYVMAFEQGMHRVDRAGVWAGMSPGARERFEPQWLAEQARGAA
jgi:hypothetical protein